MFMFKFTFFFVVFKICSCVPPALTTTTEHPGIPENFYEDLKGIKFTMESLADYLSKWNSMYISQLEPRLTSSAVTLASIDSNIRNLQERAHVWDTFQLHVAAWNEQLSTSDRKLDIISKAQQEMLTLEGKVNSFSNIEYKIDKIFKRLEDMEDKLATLNKKLESSGQFRDSLFGEFATRGILSTLKLIERKLDKIQLANTNFSIKQNANKKNSEEAKGKLTIKCNTPPVVEEILHDVASKVDVIFDKISSRDGYDEEIDNEDYMEDEHQASEESVSSNLNSDIKYINKNRKRINNPCKHTNEILIQLVEFVQAVNNNTLVILENEQIYFQNSHSDWMAASNSFINKVVNNIEKINLHLNHTNANQLFVLENYFSDQKTYFEKLLKIIINDSCGQNNENKQHISQKDLNSFVSTKSNNLLTSEALICDDIEFERSGMYHLGNHMEVNDSDEFYYIRYCEIREDGIWTVIQNRDDYKDLQNFTLDWYNYKIGFGKLYADFWFGNDFIHKLSHEQDLMLRIELEDFEGNSAWAEYSYFRIAPEYENYRLTIGQYRGNASDSLSSHNNSLFSTFDVKNDDAPDCCPCADSYGGGWWFNSCFESNLNGVYHRDPQSNNYFRGIIWEHWLGNYSLKKTKMMVKQKEANDEDETEFTTNVFPFLEDP